MIFGNSIIEDLIKGKASFRYRKQNNINSSNIFKNYLYYKSQKNKTKIQINIGFTEFNNGNKYIGMQITQKEGNIPKKNKLYLFSYNPNIQEIYGRFIGAPYIYNNLINQIKGLIYFPDKTIFDGTYDLYRNRIIKGTQTRELESPNLIIEYLVNDEQKYKFKKGDYLHIKKTGNILWISNLKNKYFVKEYNFIDNKWDANLDLIAYKNKDDNNPIKIEYRNGIRIKSKRGQEPRHKIFN